MTTPINTLWTVLMGNIPLGQWLDIATLYEILEENFNSFTEDDIARVTAYNNEPTWHRNLRNALQRKKGSGEILYDGNARYRIDKPYVWRMIKEATNAINGQISYPQIKEYIDSRWTDVNADTITAQTIILTVNHDSRIHYPENHKPRLTNSNSPYDMLFTIDRGKVVKYNPTEHGVWEIYKNENAKLGVRLFGEPLTAKTYLFVWNPDKWNWTTLEKSIEELQNSGKTTERWSCISHKTIKSGDRAFLAKVGSEPRGLFAAGYVSSEPFLSKHWSGEGKDVYRVLIDFEVLLNPSNEPILTLDILNTGNLAKQQWTPQSSGISIKPELVEELEAVWFDFLTTQNIRFNPYTQTDNETKKTYSEGTANQINQTRYERNPFARAACIKHYGYSCSVCEFDFEKNYGELGKNFIHVHHLIQVATIGKPYDVDPIKDLIPVCPNCHAMLHKQNPPLTIEYLKSIRTQISYPPSLQKVAFDKI